MAGARSGPSKGTRIVVAAVGRGSALLPVALALLVLALPRPPSLEAEGQRVLAIVVLTVGFWTLEVLPAAGVGLLAVLLLVLLKGVPQAGDAFTGFTNPSGFFLLGVLGMGMAVQKSGLAHRFARWAVERSGGSPGRMFWQMVASFPLMTLFIPSATARTGMLVHVYEQALTLAGRSKRAPFSRGIMMALNSINRLASTTLLTGGVTPITTAAILGAALGSIGWARWLVLLAPPYLLLLGVGAVLLHWLYIRRDRDALVCAQATDPMPWNGVHMRTLGVVLLASALWLTDALHHLPTVVPALLALVLLSAPRVGVLGWRDLERDLGWGTFLVLGSALSLSQALERSGAARWLAVSLLGAVPSHLPPLALLAVLMGFALVVRLTVPSIVGFLALALPVAVSVAQQVGMNPWAVGLAVMTTGDAVLYYAAQSPSSLVVYERGYLSAQEIWAFGLVMTLVAFGVVLGVAVPYWGMVGLPLAG